MALRKNPLTHRLTEFLDAAAEINHAVCFAEHERKKIANRIASDFEKIRAKGWADAFFTGNRLAISQPRQPGPRRLIFAGPGRVTSKESVARLACELAYRQNAFALAMLHEAVEHFLADAYGAGLTKAGRPVPKASRFRESETKNGGRLTPKGTPQYYAAYARWASKREIGEALKYLTTVLVWSDIHRGERFGVEYDQLVRALAFCRNTIVHEFGRLPDSKPPKVPAFCWHVANIIASPPVHGGGLVILPDAAQTTAIINEIGSFAYAVYTAFAETYDFAIDYTPPSL